FCFEAMPNDPDDPPLFQTVTLAAIVGCLSEYMASENPSKLWPDAAAAAPAQSSAAARSAAAGATSEATRGSAQTAEKARKGKQKQQPWHDYLKELIRDNIPRGSNGMYYLQGDKAKDAGQTLSCCNLLAAHAFLQTDRLGTVCPCSCEPCEEPCTRVCGQARAREA
ncbi:hypothetical protein COO60DRAFT_1524320, partial [Scenedesmus sp. NREL 46B-D3]